MSEETEHDEHHSHEPDAEEKKVVTMAVRLPVLILVAVLLMFGMGLLAMQMHGG